MISIPLETAIPPNTDTEVKERFKKICVGSSDPDKLLKAMVAVYEAYKHIGQNTLQAFNNTLRDYIETIPKYHEQTPRENL